MFVFTGKFDWLSYASNDSITIVAPGTLSVDQPVWGFWQWTVNEPGVPKANATVTGTITIADKPSSSGTRAVEFSFGWYTFRGTIGANNSNIEVTMHNPNNAQSGPWTLPLFYSDQSTAVSARTFVGKLDWFEYAQNEMVTVIFPVGVGKSAPVSLFFQWSQDASGTKKAPFAVSAILRDYSVGSDGGVKASFQGEGGYYSFNVEVDKGGETVSLTMKNPAGETDAKAPYKLSLAAGPNGTGKK